MSLVKKKKIAFVAANCFVGGVETALINMLHYIDRDRYEITLFTNFNDNPCVRDILPDVNYVNLDLCDLKNTFFSALSKFDLFKVAIILKNYMVIKVCSEWYIQDVYSCKHLDFKSMHFDVVIAYKHAWSTTAIAKKAISADKSLLWVHGILPSKNKGYIRTLCSFDHCFCVSEYIREYFLQQCPSMKEKTDIFHNILNANEIIKKAQEPVAEIDKCGKAAIVTVGRLGQDKGQIVIPETASLLKKSGIDFTWYIVGDGPVRNDIEQGIQKYHMENNICLLGTKENPYPYINACSIYVQTSTSEGWCLTTQEARILHKPCVVTDIPVMHEQFIDGVNGIIANGTDAAALYEGIMRLLSSQELRERIVNNLKAEPQDGAVEMQKLYDFLDS